MPFRIAGSHSSLAFRCHRVSHTCTPLPLTRKVTTFEYAHRHLTTMPSTVMDVNGNVGGLAVLSRIQEKQERNPSMPAADLICDAFHECGLVEVLLKDDTQVWHDAYIVDLEKTLQEGVAKPIHTCTVVLAIDGEDPPTTISNMKNVEKCPLENVRLKLKIDTEVTFTDTDKVYFAKESCNPFICWQVGKIKMAKDNFFVVEISNADKEKSPGTTDSPTTGNLDIVSKERLRPLGSYHQLTEENNPFYRFALPLSQELTQFFHANIQWLANYDLHKDFKKYSQLISVHFACEKKSLICLAFASCNQKFIQDQTIKRSQLLFSMHISKLKDCFLFSGRKGGIPGNAGAPIPKPNEFVARVHVPKPFLGLAIGKQGVNIQKARKSPGIHSLDLDDENSTFIIRGVSMEACDRAKEIICYTEESVIYPREYAELFKEKKLMDEIVNKSNVVKVALFDKEEGILLNMIGKPKDFEEFKIILNYQKAEFDEINLLKEKNKAMLHEIFSRQRKGGPLASLSNNCLMPRNFAEAVKSGMSN